MIPYFIVYIGGKKIENLYWTKVFRDIYSFHKEVDRLLRTFGVVANQLH